MNRKSSPIPAGINASPVGISGEQWHSYLGLNISMHTEWTAMNFDFIFLAFRVLRGWILMILGFVPLNMFSQGCQRTAQRTAIPRLCIKRKNLIYHKLMKPKTNRHRLNRIYCIPAVTKLATCQLLASGSSVRRTSSPNLLAHVTCYTHTRTHCSSGFLTGGCKWLDLNMWSL